jgi:hypothetical protein
MGRELELRAVARYGRVKYPTRDEARDLGIDLYRVPDSLLRRYGKGVVAGTSCLLLSTSCIQGKMYVPYILNEAEARNVILQLFSDEGVTFTEDTPYSSDGVTFNADGFNETLGIGFEYHSLEDDEDYYNLRGTPDWDDTFLDEDEMALLEEQMAGGGDAIKVFSPYLDDDFAREGHALEQDIEEFIDWLRENGRL